MFMILNIRYKNIFILCNAIIIIIIIILNSLTSLELGRLAECFSPK